MLASEKDFDILTTGNEARPLPNLLLSTLPSKSKSKSKPLFDDETDDDDDDDDDNAVQRLGR